MHIKKTLITLFTLIAFLVACTPRAANPSPAVIFPTPTFTTASEFSGEAFLISMEENGYAHLFLYTTTGQPFLRLTSGEWDDIAPAVSPDSTRVAFASNRSGYFDLYILTLATGETRQITDTPQYDSSPSWSPDSQWLTFETYDGSDLEVSVVSLTDSSQPPVPLTENSASDYAPTWSPRGRTIAFVSDQTGNPDIWLADLDRADDGRFVNLTNTPEAVENRLQWKDERLMWLTHSDNLAFSGAHIWDSTQPDRPAQWVLDADWAAWNPSATHLVTILNNPNSDYLSASSLDGNLLLPTLSLPGTVRGLAWLNVDLPSIPDAYRVASAATPSADWAPAVTPLSEGPSQRWTVVPLPDVQAPYPQLHDLADESFNALRQRVIEETGWDALASLHNAYVPLTAPLDPGLGDDWLYTGRAFALNPLMVNAGWMVAMREEIGQQTYWHIYLRAQAQDGSYGEPIHSAPWDINARYNLDPQAYERGGQFAPIPPGYWVDFTSLARVYGWERLPALPNWRTYFAGARFTEFVLTGGLDWYNAMLELYPSEALVTPTPRLPPTATLTRTPRPTSTSGPSPTPTISPTATLTPLPTSTPTPVPSNTPLP